MDFKKWRTYLNESQEIGEDKLISKKTPSRFKKGTKVHHDEMGDGVVKVPDAKADFVLVDFGDQKRLVPYSELEVTDDDKKSKKKKSEEDEAMLEECGIPSMGVMMPSVPNHVMGGGMHDETYAPSYDDEGRMAKSDLYKLAKYAVELSEMLQDDDQLEGWVQAKITKAADYLSAVKHYLEYEMKNPPSMDQVMPMMEASKRKVDKIVSEAIDVKKKVLLRTESLDYHLNNKIPVTETVFRPGSALHINLVADVKTLWKEGKYQANDMEVMLFETRLGEWAEYNGRKVPLDCPMAYDEQLNEAEYKGKKVSLGKPARGGSRKFYVYVMCGGKVKKISFGDPGLSVKVGDPERIKSFVARHKCTQKNDRCKAGYWACRIGRYPNLTGAKQRYTWW